MAQSTSNAARQYSVFASITIATVFILILLGGIVRSTGSGLGCPDWPRCFGRWVPPTEVSQLPPDYKTRYNPHNLPLERVEFNAVKTWIEYVNRLFGALTGVFVIISMVLAYRASGVSTPFRLTALATVLTGAQGFLGKTVVSTNLAPFVISAHMLLAQVIVFLLIAALLHYRFRDARGEMRDARLGADKTLTSRISPLASQINWSSIILIALFAQLFMGIAIRQQVDFGVNSLGLPKAEIVERFNWVFYIHRSFSIVLVVLIVQHYNKAQKAGLFTDALTHKLFNWAIWLVTIELLVGAALYYFDLPAASQAVHLLLASLLIAAYFALLLTSIMNRRAQTGLVM